MNNKNFELMQKLDKITDEIKRKIESQENDLIDARMELEKMDGQKQITFATKLLVEIFKKYHYLNIKSKANIKEDATWEDVIDRLANHMYY